MTQEEKAKAYDEALKKLHEIITMDNHPVLPKEIGAFLFPQLAENEKEKTKIEIIQFFRDASNGKTRVINSNTFAEWADYLENKEEQRSAEWSEEDEDYLGAVKTAVYDYFDEGYAEEIYNRLKSLRPQPRWKPSGEQMKALEDVIKCELSAGMYARAGILLTLQNDLKKL